MTALGTAVSDKLRAATSIAHENAERSAFVEALLSGSLDADAYGRLAGQLFFVYRALEEVGDTLADDPVAGGFHDERLRRLPSLSTDLATLGVDVESLPPLAATRGYVEAIRASAADPVRYVAHHYTRYLGDLSGGQIVAHRLREHYRLGDDALSFYRFAGIDKLKRYKDAYRDRLDALRIDDSAVQRLTVEAVRAFEFNSALFGELT
ncbi:biliverdin-producing heme oxygenase [Gordonia sp. TBRC 11910]|uniref:Biliverdin-producing heme oxygenase n=1 Tax=Gordonia asplenii TaxID=2725283 RepID=A0A848L717_9ACTN|nr:biliverdin-producing heme oxygenase [Gordonia asplenii]NMO03398.1 biliverdin-producing heme oxygenase [Gordonia asplenii]